MKNRLLENRTFTMAVLVLLILAFVSTGLYFSNSLNLKKELAQDKIEKELLLSEKLNLEKMINKLNNELNAQKGKNSSLDKLIGEISQKLNQKEAEVKRILRDNATVKTLRKKLAELEDVCS